MEVDVGFEDFGQLARHAVGQPGLIGGGEQGVADGAAGQALVDHQRGGFDPHAEAVAGTLDHQALEMAVGGAFCPMGAQGLQFGAVRGFGRHTAAGHRAPAEQRLAGGFVLAQKGRGGRIGQAQALEQGLGGVGGARLVAAVEGEGVLVQRLGLGAQVAGLHRLRDQAQRRGRRGGRQRGDGKGAPGTAQQHGGQGGGEAFGVAMNEIGEGQAGGNQGLLHARLFRDREFRTGQARTGRCATATKKARQPSAPLKSGR